MKKRSCRRTNEENAIHERAVKIRKMTDEKLVQYIEDCEAKANEAEYQKGYDRGYDKGLNDGYGKGFDDGSAASVSVSEFLEGLDIPGIGAATKEKLWKYAKDRGFIVQKEGV